VYVYRGRYIHVKIIQIATSTYASIVTNFPHHHGWVWVDIIAHAELGSLGLLQLIYYVFNQFNSCRQC